MWLEPCGSRLLKMPVLVALLFVAAFSTAAGQQYAAELNWPLCGFDTTSTTAPAGATGGHYLAATGDTAFPDGWTPQDGCPAGRRGGTAAEAPPDAPIRSAFGPRPLASEDERYDFHRGIDLAAPVGGTADFLSREL